MEKRRRRKISSTALSLSFLVAMIPILPQAQKQWCQINMAYNPPLNCSLRFLVIVMKKLTNTLWRERETRKP
jgi:hypothetical protein